VAQEVCAGDPAELYPAALQSLPHDPGKPRALKLLDDQLESVDLVIALLDGRSHVAHEVMHRGA
jgi:hypothetical protein